MILNGVNDETRIKNKRGMELQELHSYICRQKKPSLMG